MQVLSQIKAGVRTSELWGAAVKKVEAAKPELLAHLTEELGWGMGYAARERRYSIDQKNSHPLQAPPSCRHRPASGGGRLGTGHASCRASCHHTFPARPVVLLLARIFI